MRITLPEREKLFRIRDLIKANLKEAEVDFAEVIISLDAPAETAKKVEQPKKSSLLGRLFGGD